MEIKVQISAYAEMTNNLGKFTELFIRTFIGVFEDGKFTAIPKVASLVVSRTINPLSNIIRIT